MKKGFYPTQVLFAPTYQCNLKCRPCTQEQGPTRLSITRAKLFLGQCHKLGIKEIGFTGGEPFLYTRFLSILSRPAAGYGFRFDRLMTNGAWFKTEKELDRKLRELLTAGFTGAFCLSVDDFHKVPFSKIALFIKKAVELTGWPQCVSFAYIDDINKIRKLAKLLGGKIAGNGRLVVRPRTGFVGLSAQITKIDLCPVGQAGALAAPRGKKWFREDFCQGPGQVLYVSPNGAVKPCCGFAADLPAMSIGNINRDSAREILKRAATDPFLDIIYKRGLLKLRDIYQRRNPERLKPTLDRCFLCWRLQTLGVRKYL